ncbi:LysM peptidoglycan-binding domain-containing protein [Virgibacillus xinjiangensis]|uniref:LysM peptidoglycan-binding domain-containing protein n=1 Tax=Virgibacillus xinjiangensis TaxID=393090 RepID=A0ABV7CTG9_9BACI
MKYIILVTLLTAGLFLLPDATSAHGKYTVQPGDVLSKISMNHKVEIDTLLASNPSIEDPDTIFPGQTITLPGGNGQQFTVTAYTAGYESTGKRPGDPAYGVTASGTTVKEGQTIACPPSISFGTTIHIPALGETYTCEDRGGAITDGRLDVYIADVNQALAFGVKELQAHILN